MGGLVPTLFFLAVAAVLLVAFVVIESTSSNPLLPMRIILDRNRGGSFLAPSWSVPASSACSCS